MDSPTAKAVNLDKCIKCSTCVAQCPVAAAYPGYPGPKRLGPDEERFRLEGLATDPRIIEYCSNCKTCDITCPSGVNITDMIQHARGKGTIDRVKVPGRGIRVNLRDLVLGRAEYLGRLGAIWPGLSNAVLSTAAGRWVLEKGLGVAKQALLPSYHRKLKLKRPAEREEREERKGKQVIFFPGCFLKYNDPDTGRAAIEVLKRNGYEIILPEFHCCGAPLDGNGHFKRAGANALVNLKLMAPYLEKGIPVVASCPSCTLMLKEEYPKQEDQAARLIGELTYDLFEFLWQLYEEGELDTHFGFQKLKLGYHAPCHLKAQRIGTPSVRLLRELPGVEVTDLNTGCCGLSGSYGFKKEKYTLAMEIGRPLFSAAQTGLERGEIAAMLTECGGCKIRIEDGAGVKTEHPVQILLKAYRLYEK